MLHRTSSQLQQEHNIIYCKCVDVYVYHSKKPRLTVVNEIVLHFNVVFSNKEIRC